MTTVAANAPLIINSPFKEPNQHYLYDPSTKSLKLIDKRRPASYVALRSDSENESGESIPLELANRIRDKVAKWRSAGYPGVTRVTQELLKHWSNNEEGSHNRLFYCQIEAAETLIYLSEVPKSELLGLDIPPSGGYFQRLCAKMATGTGKTVVMAMIIAWQVINKASYPNDTRFSKYVLLVAPGLTVRKRLEVLRLPFAEAGESYYSDFDLVPSQLLPALAQGVVRIINRHRLEWESAEKNKKKRGVVKLPTISDGAYASQIFGKQYKSRKNWVVINDEAHHAWYVEGSNIKGTTQTERDESTKWVKGLDRIHRSNSIVHCFDFTATPFAPTNSKNLQTEMFGWVVSDFGLSDAIESGLVKTPRSVIDESRIGLSSDFKAFRHIYPDVKDDLNRRASQDEPLPEKVVNAYHLLSEDYQRTYDDWMAHYREGDVTVPPVQITIANRTETAKRVAYMFRKGDIPVEPLSDDERILHIDSNVLKKAEEASDSQFETTLSPQNATERQERLRKMVDTVGKVNQPGEQLTNIVSVMMLFEGWDARNVTQIMGLRAFTSQLLCEQVIGRGLRRRSYDLQPDKDMFEPEFVTVFGVPFSLLLSETSSKPKPTVATKEIKVLSERSDLTITWPNVVRIDEELNTSLELDYDSMGSFVVEYDPITFVDLGITLEGKVDSEQIARIDLVEAVSRYRLQTSIFRIVREMFSNHRPSWRGYAPIHIAKLVQLTDWFMRSKSLKFHSDLLDPKLQDNPIARKLAIALTVPKIVDHLWGFIREQNTRIHHLLLDSFKPVMSTADMPTWYTARPIYDTHRSHINRCVNDSSWEQKVAEILDTDENVVAWFKNTQRIGFKVSYQFEGASRHYIPDFIVRLVNDHYIVLEVKGVETVQDTVKFQALKRWCTAVSEQNHYGEWHAEMVLNVNATRQIINKHIKK